MLDLFNHLLQAAQQQATAAGQTVGDVGTTLSGIAGLTGAPTAAQTAAYTSPYQQQVIDTTLAEFDRQRAINEQNIRDQQAALGALGSGRAGVQLSEFQAQSGRDRAALEAQLRQQGFQQAQAARQQDIQNRFGLGQAQSGLAQQQLGLGQFQTGLAVTSSNITKSRYFYTWSSWCSATSSKTSSIRCTETSSKNCSV